MKSIFIFRAAGLRFSQVTQRIIWYDHQASSL